MHRTEYMKQSSTRNRAAGREAHRRYYAQFVDEHIKERVVRFFGLKRILESTDPNFNDMPLRAWDYCLRAYPVYLDEKMREVGDFVTDAGLVCVAKEAARQIREEAKQAPGVGTIIEGTTRPEDLIPAFSCALWDRDKVQAEALIEKYRPLFEAINTHNLDEYVSETESGLEELFECTQDHLCALDEVAPEGYVFGAHPGDGSDFGFWPVEDQT